MSQTNHDNLISMESITFEDMKTEDKKELVNVEVKYEEPKFDKTVEEWVRNVVRLKSLIDYYKFPLEVKLYSNKVTLKDTKGLRKRKTALFAGSPNFKESIRHMLAVISNEEERKKYSYVLIAGASMVKLLLRDQSYLHKYYDPITKKIKLSKVKRMVNFAVKGVSFSASLVVLILFLA